MNRLGKPVRKKIRSEKPKKSKKKKQSEIAAREQKTTRDKANFSSNTIFSLYFKDRANKISRRKTTRVTKITTPI